MVFYPKPDQHSIEFDKFLLTSGYNRIYTSIHSIFLLYSFAMGFMVGALWCDIALNAPQ